MKAIDKNPEEYLKHLQDMLINHTYHTSDYEIFYTQDGKKQRKIYKLPYFPDRIAQWAILQVIEPCLINNLTADTYSAIPKRGIHKALCKLQNAMWNHPEDCQYCLKIDARHYYQSINHGILKRKYAEMFDDPDLLWLLNEIIDSAATAEPDDLAEIEALTGSNDSETGIPIGNYLSQYSGNYYLSGFDHWVKEQKRIKYYFRYMDDIVIFGKNKETLRSLLTEIHDYFRDELRLRIKDNYQVFPTYKRGIDFLGYRTFRNFTLLRKDTARNMKRKMEVISGKINSGYEIDYSDWCCINSYGGWLDYCKSFRLRQKYIVPLKPYAETYYHKHIESAKKGLKVV